MKILICNVGSTSLKYQLFELDGGESVLFAGGAERVGSGQSEFYWKEDGVTRRERAVLPTHREAIIRMLAQLPPVEELDCVGFKVVHAKGVTGVQYLTENVLKAMEAFNSVAPAHNPPYLAAIRQFRELLPETPLIGAFETAFHQTLPPRAYLYPLPVELCRREGIRRYGFHGASLEYLSSWAAARMQRNNLRLICCHLGGSSSICAVKDGQSIDTSLGMGLQCGVMHNNRVGDMDPYIIFHLVEECGMSLADVKRMLQTQSGFLGMSGGKSGDLRDVEKAAEAGDADCQNALDAYCYSIKKYIGAYTAALGGLDAIVFGGGIGRNSAAVRARALEGLDCLGVRLDPEKNAAASGGDELSASGSPVCVFVADTNEELIVARKAKALLEAAPPPRD